MPNENMQQAILRRCHGNVKLYRLTNLAQAAEQ